MISVAIDGPAGAGKSTISKMVSRDLGFIYVDTGAIYRGIGYTLDREGISSEDTDAVAKRLETLSVKIDFIDGEQHILIDGEDVNGVIRTPAVSKLASKYSAVKVVRDFLLNTQRDIANSTNCLMDGRDIGTVVLPNATVKIFLTADPEERAKRRYDELIEKGQDVKYEEILADVNKRDYADSHREIAPLKPAEDSIIINTTGNSLEESVQIIADTIREKAGL